MSTTAIVIEHLLAGIQCVFWLGIFMLPVIAPFAALIVNADGIVWLSFLVAATTYPLGILMDELADTLLGPLEDRIKRSKRAARGVDTQAEISSFIILTSTDSDYQQSYLNYVRMRIRVTRTTFLNMLLTAAAFVYISMRADYEAHTPVLIALALTSLTISVAALWGWWRMTHQYTNKIIDSFLNSPRGQPAQASES